MIIKTFLSVFTLGGENGNCPVFVFAREYWLLSMSELGLTIAIFTCYIICVSIILEYTMTRQLGSSVLSIYK